MCYDVTPEEGAQNEAFCGFIPVVEEVGILQKAENKLAKKDDCCWKQVIDNITIVYGEGGYLAKVQQTINEISYLRGQR